MHGLSLPFSVGAEFSLEHFPSYFQQLEQADFPVEEQDSFLGKERERIQSQFYHAP